MGVRDRLRLTALAVVAAVAVGWLLYLLGGLANLEASTLQARFGLRSTATPRGIVVVAIDDQSFRRLGRAWPFPRSLDGRAVTALHAAGVREIVYDVQFTEPTTARQDNALYDALGRAGGAVLATTVTNGHGGTTVLGGNQNLPPIHSQVGNGLFATATGGLIERLPYAVGGLRTLAVVAATRATGHSVAASSFPGDGALIDFQGPRHTFPTVSFADVVDGTAPKGLLRGAIAVIGATAPSLQDLHATPAGGELMSGAELQANALWTVIHGLPLTAPPDPVALLIIAALGAVAPLAALRLTPAGAGVSALGAAIAYLAAAQLTFDAGVVVPVVAPLLALLVGTGGMLLGDELLEIAARRRLALQLYESQLELIHRLGQAAESRDQHTGEHLARIARLTKLLGRAAGMTEHESEMLRHASLMHDIGKVGIPDAVLLKTGTLTAEERRIMNTHTEIGGDILAGSESSLVQMAEAVARTHHERWDGTGYPSGLRGEQIPLAGRITSICDVFDALVTARVYKPAWTVTDTIAELRRLSGKAFDPRLVELFVELVPSLDRDLLGGAYEAGTREREEAGAPVSSV